ncbi:MAG TPA: hypothetical protein PK141_01715 [Polyangiaceae bacterium]|nr:hypothetical protein [Polyangiaceae bacterium]
MESKAAGAGDGGGGENEVLRVRGRAVSSAPALGGAFVALPTVLGIGAASRLLTAEPVLAGLLALALVTSLVFLFPRAAPRGRLALVLPLTLVALGAGVGVALSSPVFVVCAWAVAVVTLLAVAGPNAPRGARVGKRRPPLFARALSATTTTLELDAGGVRIDQGHARGYVPYVELSPPRLAPRLDRAGDSTLVVGEAAGDAEVELVLDPDDAGAAARFVERVRAHQAEAFAVGARRVPEDLLRRGASLDAWRARLDALRADGYRAAGARPDELLALFASPSATVEARAAAAYWLARAAGPATLEGHMSRRTPPLVLALLEAIPEARRLLPDDVWREARSYVPAADEGAPSEPPTPPGARVILNEANEANEANASGDDPPALRADRPR